MHELSVAESICRSVRKHAGDSAIENMVVEVGALSGVNRDALKFCLGEAARMAGLRVRRFSVRLAAARARCECGRTYDVKDVTEPCPKCGGYCRALEGGEDIVIRELLVVDEEHAKTKTGADRH